MLMLLRVGEPVRDRSRLRTGGRPVAGARHHRAGPSRRVRSAPCHDAPRHRGGPRRRGSARRRSATGSSSPTRPRLPRRQLARPAAEGGRRAGRARRPAASGAASSIRGWDDWLDLPLRVGDRLATRVSSGRRRATVAVADSTTVNLYRVASAALDARPGPADHRRRPRRLPDRPLRRRGAGARRATSRSAGSTATRSRASRPRTWRAALDDDVALVVLSLVNYRSAAIVDIEAVTAAARDAGAHVAVGPVARGGRDPGRARRARRRPRGRLHLQVPVRRPRRARLPVRRAASSRTAPAADPGLVRAGATSSRWARVRAAARASRGWLVGHAARSSRWPRSRRASSWSPRPGSTRSARSAIAPHDVRDRPPRRGPRAARLLARQPAGRRSSRRARRDPPSGRAAPHARP